MATKTKTSKEDTSIVLTEVREGRFSAVLVGRTPLIIKRLSEKTRQELLLPKGRKTAADKAANMKHDPLEEFRAGPHKLESGETLLAIQSAAPKLALASAALDIPGTATKSQIGRLTWIEGEYLPVYGIPQIALMPVRMRDIARTPDIRSHCIIRNWAIPLTISFVEPIVNPTVIVNLLNGAGMFVGIGDGRNEKGKLNFGQFSVMSQSQAEKDRTVQEIFKQARAVQIAAMEEPEPYDEQTRELLTWFNAECKVRGKSLASAKAA